MMKLSMAKRSTSKAASRSRGSRVSSVQYALPLEPLKLEGLPSTTPRRNVKTLRFLNVAARSNIKIAREQDKGAASVWATRHSGPSFKRLLTKERRVPNVVELFAGAGGMGLGFLLSGGPTTGFRILLSAEIDP